VSTLRRALARIIVGRAEPMPAIAWWERRPG
jgi:hypothetical protein